MNASPIALPGDTLAPLTKHVPAAGTHAFGRNLCASRSGPPSERASNPTRSSTRHALSIHRQTTSPLLPAVRNTVLARVTRVTPRAATCAIVAIYPTATAGTGAMALPAPPPDAAAVAVAPHSQFSGQIRAQDVRATEKDRVVVADAFRVGDVVRAVVVGLGDQRDYYLSTAGNEYGVLLAWSAGDGRGGGGGRLMEPVSWQEMRDPVTGRREVRKVAKTL